MTTLFGLPPPPSVRYWAVFIKANIIPPTRPAGSHFVDPSICSKLGYRNWTTQLLLNIWILFTDITKIWIWLKWVAGYIDIDIEEKSHSFHVAHKSWKRAIWLSLHHNFSLLFTCVELVLSTQSACIARGRIWLVQKDKNENFGAGF